MFQVFGWCPIKQHISNVLAPAPTAFLTQLFLWGIATASLSLHHNEFWGGCECPLVLHYN